MTDTAPEYRRLHNLIHQFRFPDAELATLQAYVEMWQQILPRFWHEDPAFDGVVRLLLDLSQLHDFPFQQAAAITRPVLMQHPDIPPWRTAYLLQPSGDLVRRSQTYGRLTDVNSKSPIRRAYFLPDERDRAIRWLLDDSGDF